MVKEALTVYGLWWGITRLLKWGFIFFWPAFIIYGCGMVLGSDIDKWPEWAKMTTTIVSLVISVPVYLIYRRAQQNQE